MTVREPIQNIRIGFTQLSQPSRTKFLNGERGDRGPTQRRHIIARSIVHIGKEANKLEPQAAMGMDQGRKLSFMSMRVALSESNPLLSA